MRHLRLVAALSSVAFSIVFPAAAWAQQPYPPPRSASPGFPDVTARTSAGGPAEAFGAVGQLALSTDAAIAIAHTSIGGGGSSTTLTLDPSADVFVAPNLSLGGFIQFEYANSSPASTTKFGLGPRVGYNFPLSDLVSIWPKAGVSYARTSISRGDSPPPSTNGLLAVAPATSNNALAFNLFVPFMLHPAPHFFAGFGPFLDVDWNGSNAVTTFGGKLTIGGWFDAF